MLLYDWKKIFDTTDNSSQEIVRVFRMLVEGRIPKNKYDKIYKYYNKDFAGTSFLVHPELLLYNGYLYTYKEMAVYLALASLRPLADYLATDKVSLDSFVVPTEILQLMPTNNRLLKVEDGEIHFLYERSPSNQEIH